MDPWNMTEVALKFPKGYSTLFAAVCAVLFVLFGVVGKQQDLF